MCDTIKKKPKRSFIDAWLHDDRFKSWIHKVSFDDTFYHCIICDKNISCQTFPAKHADSASHKNNIEKSTSLSSNDNVSSTKKEWGKKFKQQWLEFDIFKPWLREVSNDSNSFFCSICDKCISGGLSQIYRHAESKSHLQKSEINNTETTNDDNITDESLLPFDERKKSAEIRFAALIAEKNISFQTAKDILNFFKEVGKDSNVLQSMTMGRTKCQSIISNVLCPVETKSVAQKLQQTKFSIFIDETSDISNEKWMTFLARYVDPETFDISSQLVKLINIDARNSSAEKLFHAFQNEMYKLQIPFTNILALSCDNASVMIGNKESFKTKLQVKCKNLLTFRCPCHSAALVAHAACAKIPEQCEKFVKKVATYINNSPKRAAIFEEFCECFQETSHKILKLADTRWLSRHSCIERIIESWDAIKNFLIEIVMTEKTKTGEDLLITMQELDIKAYLLFLKHVLYFFNRFNMFFQALETRVQLLQSESLKFLKKICNHFIKPELLENISNNFDFSKKENQKALNEIFLGNECEEYITKFITEEHAGVVANI